jgi:capsular exopolysaccharide synthesis family protein
VQPSDVEGIYVIPAGSKPPNPSELLSSAAMERLIASLRESFDWVILDTAPLLVVADAAAAARWVDGVLVVTHAKASTREAARQSREQLENVGARVLGVILWGIEDTTARGGYSNYGASSPGQ